MKSLSDQLKQIPDDRERAQAVRICISALNDQLVLESSLTWWQRARYGTSIVALGKAISNLRESFPESDQYFPTVLDSTEYGAVDNTNYD